MTHRHRDPSASLEEARDWLEEHIDEGAVCPCCNRHMKIYRRKLSAGMARDLILLYRAGGADDFVYTPRIIDNSGTLSKLRYWGLIEPGESRGWWMVTESGVRFVTGRTKIPRFVLLLSKRCLDVDDSEHVTIWDALGDGFDYEELMRS
jgi:hypothetical protein